MGARVWIRRPVLEEAGYIALGLAREGRIHSLLPLPPLLLY